MAERPVVPDIAPTHEELVLRIDAEIAWAEKRLWHSKVVAVIWAVALTALLFGTAFALTGLD